MVDGPAGRGNLRRFLHSSKKGQWFFGAGKFDDDSADRDFFLFLVRIRSVEARKWQSRIAVRIVRENIVLAETKDHADWELIGKIVRQSTDNRLREVLGPAARTASRKKTNT